MNTSIKTIICAVSLIGLTSITSFAEGKPNQDWAENAALGYEKKAAAANASGNAEAAKIYRRMAALKRDAGAASKQGKDFSWKEYEGLQEQLNKSKNNGKKHDKKHGKKHGKKPQGGVSDAATGYDKKAAEAAASGNQSDAMIYRRIANIKRMAAKGELKNWDEYHKLSAQLSNHKKHANKHAKGGDASKNKGKKGQAKPQDNFLKVAYEYQVEATKAMVAGNEHNAKIYNQLSNINKEAAASVAEGKGYDWTQYFALQKQLK
jgi:hypothetical protein